MWTTFPETQQVPLLWHIYINVAAADSTKLYWTETRRMATDSCNTSVFATFVWQAGLCILLPSSPEEI